MPAPVPTLADRLLSELPEPAKLCLAACLHVERSSLDQLGLSPMANGDFVLHYGRHAWHMPANFFEGIEYINTASDLLSLPAQMADLKVGQMFEEKERLRQQWDLMKSGASRPAKRRKYLEFQESLVQLNRAKTDRDQITTQLRSSNDAFARLFQGLLYLGEGPASWQGMPSWNAGNVQSSLAAAQHLQGLDRDASFVGMRGTQLAHSHAPGLYATPAVQDASCSSGEISAGSKQSRLSPNARQIHPPLTQRANASRLPPMTPAFPIKEEPEPEQPRAYLRNFSPAMDSAMAMNRDASKHDMASDSASMADSEDTIERTRRASFSGFDSVNNKVVWLPPQPLPKTTLLPHRRTLSDDQHMTGPGLV